MVTEDTRQYCYFISELLKELLIHFSDAFIYENANFRDTVENKFTLTNPVSFKSYVKYIFKLEDFEGGLEEILDATSENDVPRYND